MIVADIEKAYDAFNLKRVRFQNDDFKIEPLKNNFNSNQANILISTTKKNNYLAGKEEISLNLTALDLRLLAKVDWNSCHNAKDAYDSLYSNLALNYNLASKTKKVTAKILESEDFLNLNLFQINSKSTKSLPPLNKVKLSLLNNYYFLINVTKINPYFQLLSGYTLNWNSNNFHLSLKNLPKSYFQNLYGFKDVQSLRDYLYQVICNYYNNFFANHFSNLHPRINNAWWLELNFPNLVKIFKAPKSKIPLKNKDLLQVGGNYKIIIANNENIYFAKLAQPLIFNYAKRTLDLEAITNLKKYFQQKEDLINSHTGQDLINYGYAHLSSLYNQNSLLKNATVAKLKSDQTINWEIWDNNQKQIDAQTNLNDHDMYYLYLNIKKFNAVLTKKPWFLPYDGLLAVIKTNLNVSINNVTSKDINQILLDHNVKHFNDVKNAIINYLVFFHNNYHHVLNYHHISKSDVLNDPKIALSIYLVNKNNQQLKENDDYNLEFDQTYRVSLTIDENDLNFQSISKAWTFTQRRIIYENDLNIFAGYYNWFYKHETVQTIYQYAALQLTQYYNQKASKVQYRINVSDLNHNLKFKLYLITGSGKKRITNLQQKIDFTKKYQLYFSISNSSYFYNANNNLIGSYLSHLVNLSDFFETNHWKISDKSPSTYWHHFYQILADFFNENTDKSLTKISGKDIKKDDNIKISIFSTKITDDNVTKNLNFKPLNQDTVFFGRYMKIDVTVLKGDHYFLANKLIEVKYLNTALSITHLLSLCLYKRRLVYCHYLTTKKFIHYQVLDWLEYWINSVWKGAIQWTHDWTRYDIFNPYVDKNYLLKLWKQKLLVFVVKDSNQHVIDQSKQFFYKQYYYLYVKFLGKNNPHFIYQNKTGFRYILKFEAGTY